MKRIGILRGGITPEYEFSLEAGAEVARAVQEAGLDAIDMLLDRNGVLHVKGVPTQLEQVPLHVDYVWNALHGKGAEDGKIGELLESIAIPHSGSPRTVSEMTYNKSIAKDQAKTLGIKVPPSLLVLPEDTDSVSEITRKVYQSFAPPWVIKPLYGGASLNAHVAHTVLELSQMIEECMSEETPFMVEQYIYGKEAAVGVIDHFREQEPYVLPTVQIERPSRGILSHIARKNQSYATVGGSFSRDEREKLETFAGRLHTKLGLKDYSQSEFVVDGRGDVWFIELDSQPHMRKNDPFLLALDAVGATLKDFVKTILGNT